MQRIKTDGKKGNRLNKTIAKMKKKVNFFVACTWLQPVKIKQKSSITGTLVQSLISGAKYRKIIGFRYSCVFNC